jgi:hypothetical protein
MAPGDVVGCIQIPHCGCVAIPKELASALGMGPGTTLKVAVDVAARSVTLTAVSEGPAGEIAALAACPIMA